MMIRLLQMAEFLQLPLARLLLLIAANLLLSLLLLLLYYSTVTRPDQQVWPTQAAASTEPVKTS